MIALNYIRIYLPYLAYFDIKSKLRSYKHIRSPWIPEMHAPGFVGPAHIATRQAGRQVIKTAV